MDDNKKPGARDISDLKARLGLKKTGTMASVTPGNEPAGTPAPSQPGAPSAPAPIPSPFGPPAQAAQPAAPAAPADPRRDPFAAQQTANLAAFYGYGQALPGSAEGGEPMEKKKPWGLIGAVVGGAVLVFIVGSFWGGISKTRSDFNETTDEAVIIRKEVDKAQKVLDTILAELRPKAGGVDVEQAARLGALDLKKPDTRVIFHTNYAHLESLAIERLFTYYNDTIKLYDAIANHAKKTAADHDAIVNYLKSSGKTDKNYGVIMDASSAIPVAKFVEVGAPICPTPGQTDCSAADLKGFKYRVDTGSPWSEKPVKGKPGETVTPLQQTPLFKTVATGSVDALAVEAYGRRLKEIAELVGALENTQKELIPALKLTAERPHVFSF